MKRFPAKKKEGMAKGTKPFGADTQSPDAHFVAKASDTHKPFDRAVADAQLYDDMERKFERVI